ncbi:kinase-like protein [Melanomma pulvis-pyrius CBS 109.77]|uniref:Kinase-like protein n=1 Tax=Melanomma pulvis-pyrius CBS 109.77 TaxID=1314802 RepID=A0A6A6XLG4_9PLEO|nr:kinase-like protein [Melanomma pulvis-pyrius CBS 109.77]
MDAANLPDCWKAKTDPSAMDPNTAFPLEGRDILNIPQAELISAAETAPTLHDLQNNRVSRITRDLVIKSHSYTLPSEANAMKLVAEKTSIRIPKVHRSFFVSQTHGLYKSRGYIVMDYIDGLSLDKCWEILPQSIRDDIIEQVADMIAQLQSLQLPTPGPLGGGPSQGNWFTPYGAGPFTGPLDLENFFNQRLEMAKSFSRVSKSIPPFDLANSKFALTHLDIAPRNLVLDSGGKVWLIDWANSGAYPPMLEIATLVVERERCKDFYEPLLQRVTRDQDAVEQFMSGQTVQEIPAFDHITRIETWATTRSLSPPNNTD